MQLYDLLFALSSGMAVGVAARAIATRPPLWVTILAGIAGSLVGAIIYVELLRFEPETPNIDWWQHIWQLTLAVVAVTLVNRVTRLVPRRR